MKIEKILNNNVAVIYDEHGNEKVVMGRGLAFNKHKGEELDVNKIDKEFIMTNPEMNAMFQELIADIPIEYLELGKEIITYAKTHLGKKLKESIYLALVDHIYTAITRFKDGIVVKNALLWDIKRFYPDEYFIGNAALNKIEDKFGIRLPDDEAGFIALHILNAQMDENLEEVYEITAIMQEVTNIVKYYFKIEFDENSVYYYRFITHLKFFAQRLINNKVYSDGADDDLYEIIKVKYNNAYNCILKISEFIEGKYNYILSKEEQLYLTIHIQRIIYKSETDN